MKSRTNIFDYKIIKSVGKGAFGQVYLAIRKTDLISVVLKQVQKKQLFRQKKNYQALVQRQLLLSLNHPGIVQFYDFFQDESRYYYVLQYLSGGEIRHLYQKFKGWHDSFIYYICQLINTLQYLHKNGIVHRDLKPQNIMISNEGKLKLLDFGTAGIHRCDILGIQFKSQMQKLKKNRNMHQQQLKEKQNTQNRSSTFVGTSYYISPQLLQKNICQGPADLWALGCIIYQLHYGITPFADPLQPRIYQKIIAVQYSFPSFFNCSPQGIDFIKKLLKKDPVQRLGVESNGININFDQIKRHPFLQQRYKQDIYKQQIPKIFRQYLRQRIQKGEVQNTKDKKKIPQILFKCFVQKQNKLFFHKSYQISIWNDSTIEFLNSKKQKKRQKILDAYIKTQKTALVITDKKKHKLKSSKAHQLVNVIIKLLKF